VTTTDTRFSDDDESEAAPLIPPALPPLLPDFNLMHAKIGFPDSCEQVTSHSVEGQARGKLHHRLRSIIHGHQEEPRADRCGFGPWIKIIAPNPECTICGEHWISNLRLE
jgi:hypothetical protein